MGFNLNPEHEPEFPECPGCGERHDPEKTSYHAINVVDMIIGAAKSLDQVPFENVPTMIASFMGAFAENVPEDLWEPLLANKQEPCGADGCKCHLIIDAFIPELHKLKLEADRVQALEKAEEGSLDEEIRRLLREDGGAA